MATALDNTGMFVRSTQGLTGRLMAAMSFDRLDGRKHKELPNRLSYSRGVLCPPAFLVSTWLVFTGHTVTAGWLFMAGLVWMGLSDVLDGAFARLLRIDGVRLCDLSGKGEALDPTMDKVAGTVAYLCMLVIVMHVTTGSHTQLSLALTFRLLADAIIALFAVRGWLQSRGQALPKYSTKARWAGKAKFLGDCLGMTYVSWLLAHGHTGPVNVSLIRTAVAAGILGYISLYVHAKATRN